MAAQNHRVVIDSDNYLDVGAQEKNLLVIGSGLSDDAFLVLAIGAGDKKQDRHVCHPKSKRLRLHATSLVYPTLRHSSTAPAKSVNAVTNS